LKTHQQLPFTFFFKSLGCLGGVGNRDIVREVEEVPGLVRPGTAGLLTSVECSRIRDSTCIVLYPIVITQIGVELVK